MTGNPDRVEEQTRIAKDLADLACDRTMQVMKDVCQLADNQYVVEVVFMITAATLLDAISEVISVDGQAHTREERVVANGLGIIARALSRTDKRVYNLIMGMENRFDSAAFLDYLNKR